MNYVPRYRSKLMTSYRKAIKKTRFKKIARAWSLETRFLSIKMSRLKMIVRALKVRPWMLMLRLSTVRT